MHQQHPWQEMYLTSACLCSGSVVQQFASYGLVRGILHPVKPIVSEIGKDFVTYGGRMRRMKGTKQQ